MRMISEGSLTLRRGSGKLKNDMNGEGERGCNSPVRHQIRNERAMKISVIVVRGGVSYVDSGYGMMRTAMGVAREESKRYPDARVYCASSDRTMRLVQTMTAKDERIVDISVRYRGKQVTSDETIPDLLWDKFNSIR